MTMTTRIRRSQGVALQPVQLVSRCSYPERRLLTGTIWDPRRKRRRQRALKGNADRETTPGASVRSPPSPDCRRSSWSRDDSSFYFFSTGEEETNLAGEHRRPPVAITRPQGAHVGGRLRRFAIGIWRDTTAAATEDGVLRKPSGAITRPLLPSALI